MRMRDWSSDVCSSDLRARTRRAVHVIGESEALRGRECLDKAFVVELLFKQREQLRACKALRYQLVAAGLDGTDVADCQRSVSGWHTYFPLPRLVHSGYISVSLSFWKYFFFHFFS